MFFDPIILGDTLEWNFQSTDEGIAVVSSSADNPCVITTAKNNIFQTNDKIYITNHFGNLAIDNTDGNFTATRISATTFSIPITGTNIGAGGEVALTRDGTNFSGITCNIYASHTVNNDGTYPTPLLALTFAWVTQNIFKYKFSATAAAVIAALKSYVGSEIAVVLYWTDDSNRTLTIIRDKVKVESR